ncbi:MAG: efflux transporter outer membrane subunit, partial [Acidobacteria bacterium]|nr:efflux transporter outer membrane subunit [Acidobacteriota bacterium]
MNKKFFILTLLCLSLLGCSLAPKYKRPEMAVPEKFPVSERLKEQVSQEIDITQIKWEDFFKDEKLKKVISIALENNKDLKIALLNVEKLQALYRIQRSQIFPSIDVSATSYKEKIPPAVSGLPQSYIQELYTSSIGVSGWEVDFFGRLNSLRKSSLYRYLSAGEGFRSAKLSLISQTAIIYYSLAADKENLSLAKATLETRKKALELIEERYKNGLASEIALNQAKYAYELSRGEALKYETIVAQDINALNLICGTPIPEELFPKDLESVETTKVLFSNLSSSVLLNRPDILQAENNLKAANADIGAARASFFPFIGITTSLGSASSDLKGLFDSGSGNWIFASQISLPIFDFGSRWNRLKASKVEKEIAVNQYQKAIQTAFKEVSDALATKERIDEQIDSSQKLVFASEETLRLSNIRYENGIDNYLTVLDAQREIFIPQVVFGGKNPCLLYT